MPSQNPLSAFALEYTASIKSLEATRSKVEGLLLRNEVTIEDVEQVYAGLFLNAFTEFEALIEDVFLSILEGTHASTIPSTKRRIEIIPNSLTREVLFEGRKYLDWLPLDKTTERAARFLNKGEPFSKLEEKEKFLINRLHNIRNAVVHKSDSAKKKFEVCIQHFSLLQKEKTPTGFLRSKPQGPSGLNQYQISVVELEAIVRKLCA
ncbi:MAG TPA: hypothetical protein VIK35_06840 [Verrucomicrobiae bacterium]